ncbi:MAG: hypothetical protein NZ901_04580 [Geminocystis sp.]|nr:hypothetical protein [Geminocystis sp.]MCS7147450.1 hypothetical protein [Geminocystis sp.]MDW8115143.1 hypothetical protein [Geminocystis sp.]MDW8464413.1 hypothetical protein [Geminocystis sp.]
MNPLSGGRWRRFFIRGLMGYLLSLLMASVVSGQTIVILNSATSSYTEPGTDKALGTTSGLLELNDSGGLIDPFGQILDCKGEEFPDYTGFVATLFEPANEMGEVGSIVPLTGTTPQNGIPPNVYNVNPYPLTNEAINGKRGLYNFLLDSAKGQTNIGRSYILLITPPPNSDLAERRVRIVITGQQGNVISYQAIALDGKPIGIDGRTVASSRLYVPDAAVVPLNLLAMQLRLTACEAQPVQIVKTADRAAAEPGDTALYRISVRNRSSAPLTNIVITDALPVGFQYVSNSAKAEIGGAQIPIQVTANGRNLSFIITGIIPPKEQNQSLNLVYAVQITPDALRGDGRNSAIARGIISNQTVADGPAIYRMMVRPGIVNDCGTIIGKVFEDKNFDGEQQEGEPGIPNAVIFMDDGNRIQTDSRGLYSVRNVLPGPRTLVLDLTSIPGYQIAPNDYLLERNSPSRLVRMSPGGLARVNFAVTPYRLQETPQEAEKQ